MLNVDIVNKREKEELKAKQVFVLWEKSYTIAEISAILSKSKRWVKKLLEE